MNGSQTEAPFANYWVEYMSFLVERFIRFIVILVHRIVIQTSNKTYNFKLWYFLKYTLRGIGKLHVLFPLLSWLELFGKRVYSTFLVVGDTEVTRDRLYQRDVNNFTLHRSGSKSTAKWINDFLYYVEY